MNLQQVAAALGGEVSGREVLAPGPGHSAKDRSLSVRVDPAAPDGIVVHSFANDDWQACKDHVKTRLGIDRRAKVISAPAPSRQIVARYEYKQADGTPYARTLRYAPKDFRQQRWNGKEWEWKGAKTPIPYRLPELKAADHDTVFIAEGEKDADNLAKEGFIATTNIGGAGNWHPDMNQHFAGKHVYILAHNDEAGADHAADVAHHLAGTAASVRIVNLPGLSPKGDVSDWLAAGGTPSDLMDLCAAAPLVGEVMAPQKLLVSSADFIADFTPPDYLIDGLLQRRFCYSLTAPTGSGKTAILLLLTACIAKGWAIGEYTVEAGRVLYFAGENPTDIQMRWIAMGDALGFDVKSIPVHFLPGNKVKLSEIGDRIRKEVEEIGPVSFVVVDTSAAYFEGDNENDNIQARDHAQRMRTLVDLPGGPCIVVACHPVKNAGNENLLPRGGGAFLNEVDGNLTCQKTDATVTLHWQGKFRGPDFAPVSFQLETATHQELRDSKGRQIPTVVAKALSDKERIEVEASTRTDEDAVLVAIADSERASMTQIAVALHWMTKAGKPNKSRVQRHTDRLKKGGFLKIERGTLVVTDKGTKEAKRVRYDADTAGASYG